MVLALDWLCQQAKRSDGGCGFVSKRDRRHYFRYVAIQSPEGRPLAEQLGIDPDHPDTFAFIANGQAFIKSEAALHIAKELPLWQWADALRFIPWMMRDTIYDWVARHRYRWFGRRETCILPNPDGSWP